MVLVQHFGLVAGKDDGEDSAGRSRGVLQSVEATVARAFDLSRETFRLMRERGLIVELPDPNELNAERDKRAVKRRESEDV